MCHGRTVSHISRPHLEILFWPNHSCLQVPPTPAGPPPPKKGIISCDPCSSVFILFSSGSFPGIYLLLFTMPSSSFSSFQEAVHLWRTFLHSLLAPATSTCPQLCILQGLHSSLHPDGICSPLSWQPAAFSSPSILDISCHPFSACVQLRELGDGRCLFKADILLVLRACIINKTALTLNVQYESAPGESGSCWVWPKSYSWKQGRTLSLLLIFGLGFDAMCNMSLPAYPPAPERPPLLIWLSFILLCHC